MDYTPKNDPIIAINKVTTYIPPKPEEPQILVDDAHNYYENRQRSDGEVDVYNHNGQFLYHRRKPNQPVIRQPKIEPPKKSFLSHFFSYFNTEEVKEFSSSKLDYPPDALMNDKQQAKYDEQCAKIKPCTVCWVQGYPTGGAMWRLLPPPYKKEDGFCMRRTPPNAKPPKKGDSALATIQVLNGKLKEDIVVEIGISKILISPQGDKIIAKTVITDKANSGKSNKTIGWGENQIPIEEWKTARVHGAKLEDFKANYTVPNRSDNGANLPP